MCLKTERTRCFDIRTCKFFILHLHTIGVILQPVYDRVDTHKKNVHVTSIEFFSSQKY